MPRVRVLLMAGSMEGGGSERQTVLLLRHLDRSRFAPELYLSYRRGALLDEVPEDVPIHSPNRPPPWLNWPGRMHHRNVVDLAALLVRRQIDVVYDRTFHMTLLAGPACRRSGVPHVSTIVIPPDRFLPLLERRFWRIKRRWLAKSYAQAHRVLAVSDAVATAARTFYALPHDQVITLRNPVDLAALDRIAAGPCPLPIGGDHFHVACVGRMAPEKGHGVLLQAAARLVQTGGPDRWRFWLIGDGPLRLDLQRHCRHLGLDGCVRFSGYQKAAVAAVAACDALVLPSDFEGMPNVVLEAFAVGTPVVATRVAGTEELAAEGTRALLVPAGDADALAAALQQVHDQPQAAADRAATARRAVEAEHALPQTVARIEDFLLQAAATAGGDRRGPAAAGTSSVPGSSDNVPG